MNNYININCDVETQSYNGSGLYAHVFDYYLSPVDSTVYSSTHHLLLRLLHFDGFNATKLKSKEFSIGISSTQVKIYDNTDTVNGDGLEIVATCDADNKKIRFYVKGATDISSPVKIQVLYATNQCNIEFNHNTYFDIDLSNETVFKSYNAYIDNTFQTYKLELLNNWQFENSGRNRVYKINGVVYVDFSIKNVGEFVNRPFNLPIPCKTSKQFPIAYVKDNKCYTATMRIDGNGNPSFLGIDQSLGESDYVVGSFFYRLI